MCVIKEKLCGRLSVENNIKSISNNWNNKKKIERH